MTIAPGDMLKRLASLGSTGLGSTSGLGASLSSALNTAGTDFASLLSKATSGSAPASGLPVTVSPRSGVTLSDDQLARFSQAADQAQAQGVTNALVFMDGQAYTLNVQSRQVTGKADLSKAAVTGIDGVVGVPDVSAADQTDTVLSLPHAPFDGGSSLSKLLSNLATSAQNALSSATGAAASPATPAGPQFGVAGALSTALKPT